MEPKRLVLIAPFATQPKATTRARVLPLARALAGRGHDVTVLVPPWDCPQEAGREENQGGLRVRWLSLPARALVPRLSWRLAWEARRLQPDLVHVFKPVAHAGLALLWLWLQRTPFPRVLDSDDWEGRGGWNRVNPYSAPQRAFFQWQEGFVPRRCAEVVTVASRTLQTQMWGLGLDPERVFYLPNGVSPVDYPGWTDPDPAPVRQRLGLDLDPTVLLYTRFVEFEVPRVAQVMSRVIARVPNARLLLVGKGFFGEEDTLREEMATRGLGAHLITAGWVTQDELPAHLAAGDVALFPMDDRLINRAKCSAKLLDLMVAGRAIVADAVGENCEKLEHRVSGWLTPPGDVEAQAAAVVALLEDPVARRSIGEAARRRIWGLFEWGLLAEQAERAYQVALDGDRI